MIQNASLIQSERSFFDLVAANASHHHNKTGIRVLTSGFGSTLHFFFVSIYLVVVVSAVVLNGSICHFYRMGYVRRNSFNTLVFNLAIADLFTALGVLPYVLVSTVYLRGVEQNVADLLCSFISGNFLFTIGVCTSIATIMVISVHRFLSINCAMSCATRLFQRKNTAYFLILLTWVFGISLPGPLVVSRTFQNSSATCRQDDSQGVRTNLLSMLILAYVLPLFILIGTLLASIRTFWCARGSNVGAVTRNARWRVLWQLVSVILVFFGCWSPLVFYWIITDRNVHFLDQPTHYKDARAKFILVAITLLQSVANPLVYGLRTPEFRRAMAYNSQLDNTLGTAETSPLIR